ncbi:sensor histidine kinase [Luteimonas soli]|uniref:Sensor histidine kinase n=1 Tax=Luteimonas soli TaxID=1648966 RepID=A0ABV7XJX9_9GAMM
MQSNWHERVDGLLSPLSLAAYAAWAAVWLAAGGAMAGDPAVAWALRAALVLFLLLFVFEHLVSERLGMRGFLAVCAAMAALALWITAMTPHGLSIVLLVLLAAVLGSRLAWRDLLLALALVNLGLAVVVWTAWQGRTQQFLIVMCAYLSFQVFAALVMRYAAQAEAMSEELRAVNADLLATRELLAESARDNERLRLSRELHDIAGHKLTALKINLAALAREARDDDERVRLCARLADELLAEIRGVIEQMRTDDGLELGAALAALATPFPRPRAHIEIAPAVRVGTLVQAEAVLRTVQEGLTNAARHSQARNLWVVLRRERDMLQLDIRDDGRDAGAPLRPGNGLTGMRERLEAAGGGLLVRRTDTGGVHLQAWLPSAA